jgi:squalene synthase HpnC
VSVGHYENFPVASVLLPARYRSAVVAVYRFARAADDIADEGDAPAAERLAALARFHEGLDAIEHGRATNAPPFPELAAAVREHRLPMAPFRDLLSAFAQDVEVTRYPTFDALLDYCRRSANPVGRLLLALYGVHDDASGRQSDAICTALQLANFCQDVGVDWLKGRVYLPLEDVTRFGVELAQIAQGTCDARWSRLMRFETERTRALFDEGAPLPRRLPCRAGIELRAVIAGGRRILQRIDRIDGDVFRQRPVLTARDWLVVACRTLVPVRAAPSPA